MASDSAFDHFAKGKAESRDWFHNEISTLRTGRVKVGLIESLAVEHYGARTPLQGLASLSAVDGRTIVISPWDPSAIGAIEKAVTAAQLGVQPVVDGKIIRLSFPSLSQEMREQTIKMLHKKAEEARVRMRQARDEALSTLRKDRAASAITEDDFYDGKEKLDALIALANKEIDEIVAKKEAEISTV